jgi:hypothetical protein
MSGLPPAIFFINGDITYPAAAYYVGAQPNIPSSYIGLNSELATLQTQLFIDDTMTKAEFDARVVADPNYPTIIHLRGLRILVILPTFQDGVNRELADVVMFLHQGQADVEYNRFRHDDDDDDPNGFGSPPCHSFEIQRLTMYELLRSVESPNVVILPFGAMAHCNSCNYPYYCDRCHTFSGIRICGGCQDDCKCGCGLIDNQGLVSSPVHLPNCDNEAHNEDFRNRN